MTVDPASRRVVGRQQTSFHDLVLRHDAVGAPPAEAATLLAQQVVAGTCPFKHWDNAVEQWILRVNWIATSAPELGLAAIDEADRLFLIEQVCSGAVSYKEIKDRQVWPAVKSWLSTAQQGLVDQYAPERITLPNGRKAKMIYSASTPPAVAARIQDLYGVERNLTIGPARQPSSSRCWRRIIDRSRSRAIWRVSGGRLTRRSRKSCSGNTRSTSGVEARMRRAGAEVPTSAEKPCAARIPLFHPG